MERVPARNVPGLFFSKIWLDVVYQTCTKRVQIRYISSFFRGQKIVLLWTALPSPLFKLGSKVPYALHKNSCYFFGEKLEELKKNSKRTSKELGTEKERQKNKKRTSEELRTKKEHLKFLFCSSGGAGVSPATIPFDTRVKGSIVLQLPTSGS